MGGALAAAGSCCASAHARQRLTYDLQPVSVADGISMIVGAPQYFDKNNGGAIVNCVFVETRAGVVVIDSGPSLRYGRALRVVGEQLPTGKIAAVINTHHHPDHFFGNQAFADVEIFGLDGTIKQARIEGDGFSDNMYRLLGDWMRGTEVVPPSKVVEPGKLEIGGRTFTILGLAGHTAADMAILDDRTGTLIAGDLAFHNRAPTTPHANLDQWRQSLDKLTAMRAKAIIPGHGRVERTGASLAQTKAYLNWLERTLKQSAADGLSMVEVMSIDMPPQFAAMGAMPQEFHRSVSHLYADIERQSMPLSNR